jgi:hypothetical protein
MDVERDAAPPPPSGDNYEAVFGKLDMLNLVDLVRLKSELPEFLPGLTARQEELLASAAAWIANHTPTTKDKRPVIVNDEDRDRTADFVKQFKEFNDRDAEPQRKAIKDNVLKAGTTIDDHFKGLKNPLDKAVQPLIDALSVYLKKQVDARGKALLAEAKRQADEANRARERAELAASDVQARDWNDLADAAQKSADAAVRKANAGTLEMSRGRTDNKVQIGLVTVYKWEVAQIMDLIMAIAAGRASVEALVVNESWMNHHCRTKDGEVPAPVPGIHIYPTYKPK